MRASVNVPSTNIYIYIKVGVVAYSCNPRIGEAEMGEPLGLPSQPVYPIDRLSPARDLVTKDRADAA